MIASPRFLPSTTEHTINTSHPQRYAPRMEHFNLKRGTKAEILAELEQYRHDREAQGKRDRRTWEYGEAITQIKDGASEVRVGSAIYHVTDWADATE